MSKERFKPKGIYKMSQNKLEKLINWSDNFGLKLPKDDLEKIRGIYFASFPFNCNTELNQNTVTEENPEEESFFYANKQLIKNGYYIPEEIKLLSNLKVLVLCANNTQKIDISILETLSEKLIAINLDGFIFDLKEDNERIKKVKERVQSNRFKYGKKL